MKTIKQILLLMAVIAMTVSCTHYDDFFGRHKTKFVTVPFEAEFIGDYRYVGPDDEESTGLEPKCDITRVIVDFEGSGTPLGNFTGNFDFCVGPDGYGQTDAYMVTVKGDTLFVSIAGNVIPGRLDDHPEHVTSYWQDPFEILGGTGRYQGARGGGISNDYNSSLDPNSHHNWSGTITMKK
ncbi:hypothetical protein DHD05_12595 [Arenibacter sp. N53]|uniref:hypothetical protein n=1 Tax=Arenibacter TaxID=178469 RepID=UPI000CD454F0|nr:MULTISPECIES: hypothetical protein [Arenibacter]MCM4152433.1 hypothetical protein [Arenibacter sp. N53]